MAILKSRIVPRNGTAATWAEVNPVLLKGEIGVEVDTRRFKFGDGLTAWNELSYADAGNTLSEDLGKINEMLKAGATLDEAKAALLALGDNYKDLFSIASTLKSFLESTDTADTTINKWKEIEQFLSGISDTDSLTALLAELEKNITEANTEQIEKKLAALFEDDIFIFDGGGPEGWSE